MVPAIVAFRRFGTFKLKVIYDKWYNFIFTAIGIIPFLNSLKYFMGILPEILYGRVQPP